MLSFDFPVVSEKITLDWDCLQANNVDFFQNPQFDLFALDLDDT
jgi:hypothetical protein